MNTTPGNGGLTWSSVSPVSCLSLLSSRLGNFVGRSPFSNSGHLRFPEPPPLRFALHRPKWRLKDAFFQSFPQKGHFSSMGGGKG